ncbi:hypothetical protein O6H91_09G093700 [Diphasiastrum complanatum]|uniref:Uncharacterized protein n=1 Tax=Diphasiastrum complanatum TaxID=34168 RepID=A0ACC2CRW3_DIPCM|nr:hypothetical protein O6H91_09G093700 [Diphasiastrum complanatum]
MSGATLAAGPRLATMDTRAPGELRQKVKYAGTLGGVMGSLRVIELQLVAFIVVFSASGLVPLVDLLFPVFASLYAFALAVLVFPSPNNAPPPDLFKGNRLFQLYVILGTIIGLFLPLAYVLGGFARGDQPAVRAATPHLFLLSFQILSENLIRGLKIFSLPVRALVPILYNARRLISLSDWLQATFLNAKLPSNPRFQDVAWMWFGRCLSAANFLYFSANLLAFLLPLFLPRAFERYFKERDQAAAKETSSSAGVQKNVNKSSATKQHPQLQKKNS